MNVSEFECDNCGCELIFTKVISFADNQPPVFVNPPASGTFACILQATPMGPLNYTDNCIPAGSVPGTESGATNACDGESSRGNGKLPMCGNTANWTQTLDVNAVAMAAFINPLQISPQLRRSVANQPQPELFQWRNCSMFNIGNSSC